MIYMEQFKDGNSFEQRKEELRRLIAQKKEFAVYDDQYDELFDSVEQYEGLIKEGISLTDYEQEDYETKKRATRFILNKGFNLTRITFYP